MGKASSYSRWRRRRREEDDEETARHAAVAAVVLAVHRSFAKRKGSRGRTERRQRMNWEFRKRNLKNKRRFMQRYRFDAPTFDMIADTSRDDIEPDATKSRNASCGQAPITAEIMLSATLRWVSGGAYQDIIDLHGIGESTFYAIVLKVSCRDRCCSHSWLSGVQGDE